MYDKDIIQKTAEYVKNKMMNESTGHDWWHVYRVWKAAKIIAEKEDADMFVVELSALLHDIADHKFHNDDHSVGPRVATEFLESLDVDSDLINKVCDVISSVSFSKGLVPKTIEAKVVQDADRLDALGAIGIARCFSYSGYVKRGIYDPTVNLDNRTKEKDHAINHFYEKLLLLKDKMNTEFGKKMAEQRHEFIEQYLKQFYLEWEGKDLF